MDVLRAIAQATEAADNAPEDLRTEAFTTVLAHLLTTASPTGEAPRAVGETLQPPAAPPATTWEEAVVEGLPEPHVVRERGNRGHQALWAVVTLQGRGVAATTEDITKLIRTELGLAPQNVPNTARTLRGLTPRYVMRRDRDDGQGYIYQPTAHALDAFEGL